VKTADKRFKGALQIVVTLAFVGVVQPGVGKQTPTAQNLEQQPPPPLIRSVEGPDLFRAYCTPLPRLGCQRSGSCSAGVEDQGTRSDSPGLE
jgi:hypothetical protein